jgi:hypothetical protein
LAASTSTSEGSWKALGWGVDVHEEPPIAARIDSEVESL